MCVCVCVCVCVCSSSANEHSVITVSLTTEKAHFLRTAQQFSAVTEPNEVSANYHGVWKKRKKDHYFTTRQEFSRCQEGQCYTVALKRDHYFTTRKEFPCCELCLEKEKD